MTSTHLQVVKVDDLFKRDNGHFCSGWQSGLTPTRSCTIAARLIMLLCNFVVLVGYRTAILICAIDNLLERPA